MGVLEDCVKVVKESIGGLGGLDVIVSNAVCDVFSVVAAVVLVFLWFLDGSKRARLVDHWTRAGRSSRSLEI